ncbi:multidrug transporter [Lentzea tibetensis]|uniref:Multidrug transporter n=2 Tax=Lentzea tibetensis TaxID=2591470 RepID=A0A563EFH6_9PSEU|nr:multidrug transporter [Lentzea tibetensis]
MLPVPAHADLPDLETAEISRRIETARESRPVAPGVTLSSFDWYEPGGSGGWMRGDALTVDLTSGVRVGYLSPGTVSSAEPLSAQATRMRAVAAVNGDFFDINNSNAPAGVGISDGALVKSAQAGHHRAVGVDAAGIGRVMEVFFTGALTTPSGTVPLTQLNSAAVGKNGVGVFNPFWGGYSRSRAVEGVTRVTEVVARQDVVTEVRTSAGGDAIPADGYVLVGREDGADALARLRPGDRIGVTYAPRTSDGSAPVTAIGGNQLLVKDGVNVAPADPLHPRTAVGFSADGRRMFLLTVDGRQAPYLLGLNLRDLAEALREMGAHNALNLDGGGSSTMLARSPGGTELDVANTPSDGAERPVPNGLALYAPEGSGALTGFRVTTKDRRVFPGLSRRLDVQGHDETFGPAPDEHRWEHSTGRVEGDLFRAGALGAVRLTAYRDAVRGSVDLTVLGPLTRLSPTATRLSLSAPGDRKPLGINGFDPEGFTASIEPGDLQLEYDHDVIEVTPELEVVAKTPGATTITARAGGHTTHVGVTVGAVDRAVADFDDGARWTFGSARATGSVAPVPDGHTGAGLRLSYDFTQSTGTRTAYAVPPRPIQVDGQPLALSAWVRGQAKGEWTAFTVTDALGQTRSLYGPYITWNGWRRLEVAIPPEMALPLQVNRFYTIETKADRQYTGEVLVDDIAARVPPSVTLPPVPPEQAAVVVQDGTVAGKDWRFAVMSDAQFVARAPDSELVRSARRTMREIKAARPDFVVINGDLVDEASPADLAFAHRILREELGEVPWYYVPGNHEIMGPGTIDNFRREFGATNRTFDHKGTRFVLLDSSTGTIRGGGFDQMVMLRDALESAPGKVVVLEHHPPRDPTPAKGSQLGDRMEAAYVERLLSGRDALFVGGHVGVFHASTVDGVPYLINGNSGKAPAEPGGFTGWTLVGVDSGGFAAEIRPHVDAVTLTAPSVLQIGKPEHVSAAFAQGSRRIPVAYPVSADWSGSPGLHVGAESGVKPWHVAWLDPGSGVLTAVRTGQVSLAITVNGVTRRHDVRVALPEEGKPAA